MRVDGDAACRYSHSGRPLPVGSPTSTLFGCRPEAGGDRVRAAAVADRARRHHVMSYVAVTVTSGLTWKVSTPGLR
jgi:hypothetical protein